MKPGEPVHADDLLLGADSGAGREGAAGEPRLLGGETGHPVPSVGLRVKGEEIEHRVVVVRIGRGDGPFHRGSTRSRGVRGALAPGSRHVVQIAHRDRRGLPGICLTRHAPNSSSPAPTRAWPPPAPAGGRTAHLPAGSPGARARHIVSAVPVWWSSRAEIWDGPAFRRFPLVGGREGHERLPARADRFVEDPRPAGVGSEPGGKRSCTSSSSGVERVAGMRSATPPATDCAAVLPGLRTACSLKQAMNGTSRRRRLPGRRRWGSRVAGVALVGWLR